MYALGDLVEDFTSGSTYAREILAPDGSVVCYVIETLMDKHFLEKGSTNTPAMNLIDHLNRS